MPSHRHPSQFSRQVVETVVILLLAAGVHEAWRAGLGEPRILFDCFFYSLLNFTFFGFGDITPQLIPAKLVTLMEVTLAFFTVIFLLSDFISLKDSLRGGR
jgi:hypothetical protein